jgi:hypothetical protein
MSIDREPLVTQALPQLTVVRREAARDARPVACACHRRIDRRLAGRLVALSLFFIAALYLVWNRTDAGYGNESRGGVARYVKITSNTAADRDLLDDAQREEGHAAHIYSGAPFERNDLLDDAQREQPTVAPNTARI